ncbi:MAG: sugar ABC transporter permease [Anaerolineae bacterium]
MGPRETVSSQAPPLRRLGQIRRPSLSLRAQEAVWFHIFILPWLLAFLIFTLGPMIASLALAFTRYNAIQPPQFVGLKNFILLANDEIFWKSMRVTLVYTVVFVPLQLSSSLFLAILLNTRVPGMRVIRTIYYLPSILPAVVTALVWVWMFNPDFGLLNYLIYVLTGVKGPNWLGSERWVMPAIIISGLWGIGSGVIIFLAALQNVPQELYEAAELDGASMFSRFWNITVPMISPVIMYNLLIGMIWAFQTFARIYVMTEGGPNYASYFYNLYLYHNAFSYLKLGLASAQAWILFVIILILTLIALKTSGRWVYYAGG